MKPWARSPARHKPGSVVHTGTTTREWRQEDWKLKVIFGYMVSSRQAWATAILSQNKDQNLAKNQLHLGRCAALWAWTLHRLGTLTLASSLSLAFDIHVPLASDYSTLKPLSCPSVIQSNPDSFLYPNSSHDSSLTRSPSWPLGVPTGSVPVSDPSFSLLPEEHLSPQDLWTPLWGDALPRDVPVVHSTSWSLLNYHFFLCLLVQCIPSPSGPPPCFILSM